MSEGPTIAAVQPSTASHRLKETCNRLIQRLPPKARIPVIVAAVAVLALAVYLFVMPGAANLNLICRHSFPTAEVWISIDGKPSFTEHVSGNPRKLLGLFGKGYEGRFSKSVALASGRHEIEVRVVSAEEDFDQTKTREVNLDPGKEGTLVIAAKRGDLSLSYEDLGAPAESSASTYFAPVRTLLVTIIGSAMSAVIGFFVQDFLRSRKPA